VYIETRKLVIYMAIYLMVFISGSYMGFQYSDTALEVVEMLFGLDGEPIQWSPTIILTIFFRNLATATMILASSPVVGVLPTLSMFINGFVVGGVVTYSIYEVGRTFLETMALLLPHGVIEIPTLLYASALSLETGLRILRRSIDMDYLNWLLRIYLRRITPLLFIAAAIETFITPTVAGLVRNLV